MVKEMVKAWLRRDSPKPPGYLFFPSQQSNFLLLPLNREVKFNTFNLKPIFGCLSFAVCTLMQPEYLFRFAVNRKIF